MKPQFSRKNPTNQSHHFCQILLFLNQSKSTKTSRQQNDHHVATLVASVWCHLKLIYKCCKDIDLYLWKLFHKGVKNDSSQLSRIHGRKNFIRVICFSSQFQYFLHNKFQFIKIIGIKILFFVALPKWIHIIYFIISEYIFIEKN